MRQNWHLVSVIAISFVGSLIVPAAWGQDEIKGTIMKRSGDTLLVKTDAGNVPVVLTASTIHKGRHGTLRRGRTNR